MGGGQTNIDLKDSIYGRPFACKTLTSFFAPAFLLSIEIWKLMETNKVNIDAKLYRQKIGLHCSIAPLCMEIGQPVALIQTKVSITEVKSCHTFM